MVKNPCQGCIYYKACGSTTRTAPCAGRKTKRDIEREKTNLKGETMSAFIFYVPITLIIFAVTGAFTDLFLW
jgi:hypothetical protein